MYEITKTSSISSDLIRKAKQEGLVFSKSTEYYTCSLNGKIVGFFGLIKYKNKVVHKNMYVLPDNRGNGVFKTMFNYAQVVSDGNNVEATCTKMSVNHYLKNGFHIVKQYKNGCTKVRNENIH